NNEKHLLTKTTDHLRNRTTSSKSTRRNIPKHKTAISQRRTCGLSHESTMGPSRSSNRHINLPNLHRRRRGVYSYTDPPLAHRPHRLVCGPDPNLRLDR